MSGDGANDLETASKSCICFGLAKKKIFLKHKFGKNIQ